MIFIKNISIHFNTPPYKTVSRVTKGNNMKLTIGVEIPSVPNFLKTNIGMVSITEFGEKELNQIGKDWTKMLIQKSKRTLTPPTKP